MFICKVHGEEAVMELKSHPYSRVKPWKPTCDPGFRTTLCPLRLTPGSSHACGPDSGKRLLPNPAQVCRTQDPASLEAADAGIQDKLAPGVEGPSSLSPTSMTRRGCSTMTPRGP